MENTRADILLAVYCGKPSLPSYCRSYLKAISVHMLWLDNCQKIQYTCIDSLTKHVIKDSKVGLGQSHWWGLATGRSSDEDGEYLSVLIRQIDHSSSLKET